MFLPCHRRLFSIPQIIADIIILLYRRYYNTPMYHRYYNTPNTVDIIIPLVPPIL